MKPATKLIAMIFALALAAPVVAHAQDAEPAKNNKAGKTAEAKSDKPKQPKPKASETVNVNTATPEQLQKVPGIDAEKADKLVAGRPWANRGQLTRKKIFTKEEMDKVGEYFVFKDPSEKQDDDNAKPKAKGQGGKKKQAPES